MANPTTNFGWVMPTSTDLVTDLPADFAVFGQAVDTSLADLKGGTTGQVLSKNSNTDMDFTWVAPTTGDITGVSVTSPITGGGTSGDVTIGISSSAVVPDQSGNSGKYLTTDGTNSSWATLSTGAFTQIATGTLSGSSVTISSIASTYKHLVVAIHSAYNSAADEILQMRFNSDTGANYEYYGIAVGASIINDSSIDQTKLNIAPMGSTNSASYYSNGLAWIYNYTNTTRQTIRITGSGRTGSTTYKYKDYLGYYNTSSAISSITLLTSAGTFSGGTYVVYGVN